MEPHVIQALCVGAWLIAGLVVMALIWGGEG